MTGSVTIATKWAVSPSNKVHHIVGHTSLQVTLKDLMLFDELEEALKTQGFLYRVYQIVYEDILMEDIFLTYVDAEQKKREIEEAMTDEEMFDYLEGLGYDIRFDDGELNFIVAGEMAANEGIKYNDEIDLWFK